MEQKPGRAAVFAAVGSLVFEFDILLFGRTSSEVFAASSLLSYLS